MKLEGFIEFLKFVNVYTPRERKDQQEFMNGILNSVVYFWQKICMHQTFDVHMKFYCDS